MKRIMIILFTLGLITTSSSTVSAMSESKVRSEALFLTDRMAYELNLNNRQLNDVYEINYDFIYAVQDIMPNVMRGETWAVNRYYALLDFRNEDLRWVLSDLQFRRFMNAEHFYRPIYASNTGWSFRIHLVYTNSNFFYFARPKVYISHRFDSRRHRHAGSVSPYKNRHHHTVYNGKHSVRQNTNFNRDKHKDFGPVVNRPANNSHGVNNKPSTSNRPTHNNSQSNAARPENNNRPNNTTNRPNGNSNKTNSARPTGTATKPANNTNNNRETTPSKNNNTSTVRRSATEQKRSNATSTSVRTSTSGENKTSTSNNSRNATNNTNTSRTSTRR